MPTSIWTHEREAMLRDMYPDNDTEEVARRIGVTKRQAQVRAHQLRIRKSAEGLRKANEASMKNGSLVHGFRKGNVPWNKGGKHTPEAIEKMRPTQFKKGDLPPKTKYDGAVTIRNDHGTREPYQRISLCRWKRVAVITWEKHFGAVPKGHIIRVRNGDSMDVERVDNLECVSRSLNMLLNSRHGYSRDQAECLEVINQVEKQIERGKHGGKK